MLNGEESGKSIIPLNHYDLLLLLFSLLQKSSFVLLEFTTSHLRAYVVIYLCLVPLQSVHLSSIFVGILFESLFYYKKLSNRVKNLISFQNLVLHSVQLMCFFNLFVFESVQQLVMEGADGIKE